MQVNIWFLTKVKFFDEETQKDITKNYLIHAVNYTEAETEIHRKMAEIIKGSFQVLNIAKSNIAEILDDYNDFDDLYSAKIQFTVSTDNGKEKVVSENAAVVADSIQMALDRVSEHTRNWITSYEIVEVKKTNVEEYFVNLNNSQLSMKLSFKKEEEEVEKIGRNGERFTVDFGEDYSPDGEDDDSEIF